MLQIPFSQLQSALYHYFLLCLYSCLFQSLTIEMAKRKANLRMHAKSVTLDGTSTQDADQASNQAIVDVSTQGMGF